MKRLVCCLSASAQLSSQLLARSLSRAPPLPGMIRSHPHRDLKHDLLLFCLWLLLPCTEALLRYCASFPSFPLSHLALSLPLLPSPRPSFTTPAGPTMTSVLLLHLWQCSSHFMIVFFVKTSGRALTPGPWTCEAHRRLKKHRIAKPLDAIDC